MRAHPVLGAPGLGPPFSLTRAPQVGISLPRGLRGKTGPSPGAKEGESQVSLQRPHPLHSTRALTQKHLWGLPETESKAEDSTRMLVGTGRGWGGIGLEGSPAQVLGVLWPQLHAKGLGSRVQFVSWVHLAPEKPNFWSLSLHCLLKHQS